MCQERTLGYLFMLMSSSVESGAGTFTFRPPSYDVFDTPFAYSIFKDKYSWDRTEDWSDTARRVVTHVCADRLPAATVNLLYQLICDRKFIPGGRYLYSAGRPYHSISNCFAFRAEDSREGWADAVYKATMCLMSGGGVGFDYSALRPEGAIIKKTGGTATGPLALMQMINEMGRHVMQGGSRRSAILATLHWTHPDVGKFLVLKNHSPTLKMAKATDLTFPLPMEMTNVSVNYDKAFFDAYEAGDAEARRVWALNCLQAFSSAEPGFSFNCSNSRESLRNACGEFCTEDDSDRCNLGTLWIHRFQSDVEFKEAIEAATAFLLCGGIYSDYPMEKIKEVGIKNNRIGLGLGGVHEWLMLRGEDYVVTPELHTWCGIWRDTSDESAKKWAAKLGVNEPKGKRAVAPNGTVGIVAESTTGIEPLFCAAYSRRYLKDNKWHYQYVIDGAVKRLLKNGVPIEVIERNDAYALDFERRVSFQADIQGYTDMGISSTINMPAWGTETNNEASIDRKAEILLRYAPRLRGVTCYPDGCRGGQPLTKISIEQARQNEGHVFLEEIRECTNGVCGI